MSMSIDEHGEALDMILQEFDGIQKIHRECIKDEYWDRDYALRALSKPLPVLTTKERAKNIAKERRPLLKLLKYKTSHELGYASTMRTSDFHTEESVRELKKSLENIKKHPKFDDTVAHNDGIERTKAILRMERDQRVALLLADAKEYKMDFITGKRALSTFLSVSQEFRKEVY